MTIKGKKVGFVGAGNMGEALIKGLLAASLVPAKAIYATDVRLARLKELDRQYGIQIAADNTDLVRHAVFLGTVLRRPAFRRHEPAVGQRLEVVFPELRDLFQQRIRALAQVLLVAAERVVLE
ncbi:MAG: NAD(P)-binding domain-containing protein, partial [candidate division NC10 bacterium]